MDKIKYKETLESLLKLSERLDDSAIDYTLSWIRAGIEENHKPTIAFAKFNLNHTETLKLLNAYWKIEIPTELKDMIDGDPVCLIFDYSEKPMLLSKDEVIGKTIVFGVPCDSLKQFRVALCDEIQSKEYWLELSGEIDVVCLLVNATMAMTQMEKDWLRESAACYFTENDILLSITNMDRLNEAEDAEAVRKTVSDYLMKINSTVNVYENIDDAIDCGITLLKAADALEKHKARILKNGLSAIKERLVLLNNGITADQDAIDTAIRQLQRKKQTLELAGQMASESILTNAVNAIKNNLCNGIADYEKQMVDSIVKTIKSASIDKLESMEDRINGYISGSWDYYIKTMSAKVDEEIEKVSQRLVKQIEADSEKVIADLDNSTCLVMYEALGLFEEDDNYGLNVKPANPLVDVRTKDVTDKLKKETRNMMLLSIPLFFVNPLISIGNIFAAKACEKIKTDSELEDVRSKMINMVEVTCNNTAEELISQVNLNFEHSIRVGSANIRAAYNNLIQQLEDNLNTWYQKQSERKILKEDIERVICELISQN